MKRLFGIDISKWQEWWVPGIIPDFAFLRTSYGTMKDKLFETFYAVAVKLNIPVGVYHYFSSGSPWKDQADLVISLIKGKKVHKIALDFEGAYNNFSKDFALCAVKWMEYVEVETGIEVVIYTSPYTYRDHLLAHTLAINSFKLWIAQYPSSKWTAWLQKIRETLTGKPYLKITGREDDDYWGWQFTKSGPGSEYGVGSTYIDLNLLKEGVVFLSDDIDVDEVPDIIVDTLPDVIGEIGMNVAELFALVPETNRHIHINMEATALLVGSPGVSNPAPTPAVEIPDAKPTVRHDVRHVDGKALLFVRDDYKGKPLWETQLEPRVRFEDGAAVWTEGDPIAGHGGQLGWKYVGPALGYDNVYVLERQLKPV